FPALSRHPPRPPLFPYTTLFRSDAQPLRLRTVRAVVADAADLVLFRLQPHLAEAAALPGGDRNSCGRRHAILPVSLGSLTRVEGDRKSTRLNSSHLGISYAVFCL